MALMRAERSRVPRSYEGKCSSSQSAAVGSNPTHAASDPALITMRASPSRRTWVSWSRTSSAGPLDVTIQFEGSISERPAIGERRAQLSGIASSPRPRERDPDERRDRLAIVDVPPGSPLRGLGGSAWFAAYRPSALALLIVRD